ncbi:DNA polymerase [Acinetobacter sp. A47]|uniref:DNA polymerase n=1 Tax=Acinetobacter sp. A47 TaxID=1561217 RepID=UPI00056F5384|nr:DNA polymerase [Acinetobacter sp. A47]
MRHLLFAEPQDSYDVAILIKPSSFNEQEILNNYVKPLEVQGISRERVIAFTLEYGPNNKVTATQCKQYLEKLLPVLAEQGIKYLYCADAPYFKVLAKQTKAEPHYGYRLNVGIKDFEYLQVTLGTNWSALTYNPNLVEKLDLSVQTLADIVNGTYAALGQGIIEYEDYPDNLQKIEWALNRLHQYPVLTCDTETFSLKFYEAGLGTCAFAWSKHEGMAFPVEITKNANPMNPDHCSRKLNPEVKKLLRRFLESYKGKLVFHNAAYDIKVLIYSLWMRDPLDREGLLHGLDVLTRNMDDTKLIIYLATNSAAGNFLSLKDNAHEFAGNWAQSDIADIRKIPYDDLLRYNLVDCLSTWYVYEKYYPIMVRDQQEKLYKEQFLPTLKVIIQMELIGMPMDADEVQNLKRTLVAEQEECLAVIEKSQWVDLTLKRMQLDAVVKYNGEHIKQKTVEDFCDMKFNPGSPKQLGILLYNVMTLPVLDRTKTKEPATGADVLEKLLNHTDDPTKIELLNALHDLAKVDKIISSFVPAFEGAVLKADGTAWLHGNFNLGGTVSGRLSSSGPNLQNLPSGSKFGKPVKTCFRPPKGFLFGGADFNSLEDYISALTTKDPNKLKVYLEGYDGHCLRAFYYFPEQMPDIVEAYASTTDTKERVFIVNSIKKKYPELRQKSKAPTFALTYQGTWTTLVKNCGFAPGVAKQIEKSYHDMYKVSDAWVAEKLKKACKTGYVEVAFGLRVRTPLLKQSILGNSKTLKEAEAEGRTAGNALGQSYGMLNNRAAVEFMNRVWNSPYRQDIFPVALIHDAIYLIIRDDLEIVTWANKNLIECMSWQELPEIQHDKVKLGAALDIFHPSWANEITLPNNADAQTIKKTCIEGHRAYYS